MMTKNYYYKKISEKLNGKSYEMNYTIHYYLREICKAYNIEYEYNMTLNRMLHDFCEAVTGEVYTASHTNHFYLHMISDYLTGDNTRLKTQHYYLKEILEHINLKPVPASLSLVSDKSILSYYDHESTVLTATLLDEENNPITGETVLLYDNNDNLISDMTDNNDGTYSTSYNSDGIGDIGFYAKIGDTVSNTITIHDYYIYDSAENNSKQSLYGSFIPLESENYAGSLTYDSTVHAWQIEQITNKSTKGLTIPSLQGLSDFKFSVDLYIDTNTNCSAGIFIGKRGQGFDYVEATPEYGYYKHNYGESGSRGSISKSSYMIQEWFTLEYTYTNNKITARWLDANGVEKCTHSTTITYTPENFGIAFGWVVGNIIHFKNVKVELL